MIRLIYVLCILSVQSAAEESGLGVRYWDRYGDQQVAVCREVGQRAHLIGLDPVEVIAVSYVETRHTRGLVSPAGARGPLQALPKYWSRSGDLDFIDAGLRAWAYYRGKSKNITVAAGRYNGGGAQSGYARAVTAHADQLRTIKQLGGLYGNDTK